MSANTGTPSTATQRTRINRACEACRGRKVKCNGTQPCVNCWQHSISCTYRIQTRKISHSSSDTTPRDSRSKRSYSPELGFSNTKTGSFQFYGPSSHFCFVQRVYQRIHQKTHETLLDSQKNSVPGGVQKWGLERFMFAPRFGSSQACLSKPEAFLRKEIGDGFLDTYFRFIHPLAPVLSRSEIITAWEAYWEPPLRPDHDPNTRGILFMLLALGARVSRPALGQSAEALEKWAEYFSSQTSDYSILFQEPSFKGVQFLLLKAMDALQAMRPNDAYLLLGHAARSALAVGLNTSQVANGNSFSMHRLRVTFWTIYFNERMSSLFTGRSSCLVDEHIDVSYPGDLPSLEGSESVFDARTGRPTRECAWLRAMADIGRISAKMANSVFSIKCIQSLDSLLNIQVALRDCDIALDAVAQKLPLYLHFFDASSTVGEEWQEIQRTHLGLTYNLVRMSMHRPALIFTALHSSKTAADSQATGFMALESSIETCTTAAKDIITLCGEVILSRLPAIRNDASVAAFLISACITLLYDVLGPDVPTDYAIDIFGFVDQGIHCLDQMEHVGPTTGKTLSIDVMQCAKKALNCSSDNSADRFSALADGFPWLK
ncbi:fungal-specific transcription factor domain-containing protein [Aspergillus avenaceus]|uniref:Fungal-specific transcription factor domain-containing protein n=1 Tax=Aspergillus avenaceus TaxID=36643 RepID=A0A5N6U2C7_ASPAV|nr:fungal-specific transcription factor domain-containing protein [Aspergillus avenaceus]